MYVLLCYVGQADLCLEAKLEQFSHDVDTFDVIINHSPVFPLEKFYLPYIGSFLPCDTIANAVYAVAFCLCFSVTSWSSVETDEQIELGSYLQNILTPFL